jgi:hypothetical protein
VNSRLEYLNHDVFGDDGDGHVDVCRRHDEYRL